MMQWLIWRNKNPLPSLEKNPTLMNLRVIRAGVEWDAVNQVWDMLTEHWRDAAVLIAAQ